MRTFLPFTVAQVERVGFTRNASQTPYVVYITASGRRCCTFVKRKLFYELLRLLLGITEKVDAKVLSTRVTEWNGLIVKTHSLKEYVIVSTNVCAFFLHYHIAAFNRLTATLNDIGAAVQTSNRTYLVNLVRCDCTILHDCCPHRIAAQIQLFNGGWASVAEYMQNSPKPKSDRSLARYTLNCQKQICHHPQLRHNRKSGLAVTGN